MLRLRLATLVAATALLLGACRSGTGPEAAPACMAPAPLLGRADARAPGYVEHNGLLTADSGER